MGLKEQLQQDLKQAMRAQHDRRKLALRMVLTEMQLAEVENKAPLSDDMIIGVIQKEVRRREDALEMVREAGRDDLVADDVAELEILRGYLPQPLSEEEVQCLAQEVIAEVGADSLADLGKVMQAIMPQVAGKAGGRMVNQIVRKLLSA